MSNVPYQSPDSSSQTARVEGFIDILDRRRAIGWAWVPAAPGTVVAVEASIDGRVLGRAVADISRPDLAAAGLGTGLYGFELVFDEALDSDAPPVFVATDASGSSQLIVGEEATIDLGGGTRGVEGYVDTITAGRALGWAWLPDEPDAALFVEAIAGTQILGTGTADRPRPELLESGRGTGRYGFDLSFDATEDGPPPVIRVSGRSRRRLLRVADHADLAGANSWDSAASVPLTAGQPGDLRIEGYIDRMNPFEASGWAWAAALPEGVLQIEAFVGERIVGRTLADRMRKDLFEHGVGTGRYGFEIKFIEPLSPIDRPIFRVLLATDRTLECNVGMAAMPMRLRNDPANATLESLIAGHARYTSRGPEYEDHDPAILPPAVADDAGSPLVMAFYLPQFHPIAENDAFWGKGFTEWRQLPRALSRFPGHYQPRIPRDLGFYNLTDVEHLRAQATLAKASGINAFAFYYYSFNGRRVLEQPLDLLLSSDVEMPLLLIWANENWTRTWDGSDTQVLLRQDYRPEDEAALLADFARHFHDRRYVRIDGRPLFVIYNPSSIPDTRETVARWRETLRTRHGLDPLFFMCQTFGVSDPEDYGFDGAMEFPPHKIASLIDARPPSDTYSPDFAGQIVSYDDFAAASLDAPDPEFPLIKTALPGWDNDARRPNRSYIIEDIAPGKFEAWLRELIERAIERPILGRPIVAINAWNEWAESAYLEPDVHYGAAYLNAAARAIRAATDEAARSADRTREAAKVSVIVPNYNHARYLPERLGSVLAQTVPPDEIIFLDDCSTDDSLAVATAILEASAIPYRIVANETNSGGVFRQWIKGLDLARNDLVWIAESDDSADHNFLARLLPAFERPDVMAAYGRIRAIDADGEPRGDLDGYYEGLDLFHWHRSTVVPAFAAFQGDFTIKNVIPNASGLVFRKPDLTPAETRRLYEYRFAGDWYFYALVVRGGAIAYQHRARSFFRIAETSTSRSALFTERHLKEHAMILEDLAALYDPDESVLRKHVRELAQHFPDQPAGQFVERLMPGRVRGLARPPLRLCIAAHSFTVGGGELLPLELANAMKTRGHHVTYLVMERETAGDRSLRVRLRRDIPVVQWDDISDDVPRFLADYGIQLFNSHNLSVESNLAALEQDVEVPYVASLHGGYEHSPEYVTPDLLAYVGRTVDRWLYLADKNKAMLIDAGFDQNLFERSFNALPAPADDALDRADFRAAHGIGAETCVLVLISRAIAAKGWQVAIDGASRLVAEGRDVHLLLVGDGPDLAALQAANEGLPFVGFLGHVDRPARLLAACDLGVFPSVFAGETFPLFLLECFQAGLPVISTDIGEIPYIMGRPPADRPGAMIAHDQDGARLGEALAAEIATLIDDPTRLRRLRANATRTIARFSMDALVALYERVFDDLADSGEVSEAPVRPAASARS